MTLWKDFSLDERKRFSLLLSSLSVDPKNSFSQLFTTITLCKKERGDWLDKRDTSNLKINTCQDNKSPMLRNEDTQSRYLLGAENKKIFILWCPKTDELSSTL